MARGSSIKEGEQHIMKVQLFTFAFWKSERSFFGTPCATVTADHQSIFAWLEQGEGGLLEAPWALSQHLRWGAGGV